jgi:two-component system LytT family response regulator
MPDNHSTNTMIRVILIDDEPLGRMLVREYLETHPGFEIIKECSDGFEGIKAIQDLKPDLVFLDIQMPKLNGFEMLELIDEPPHIIFTTAFDEYAFKAFEADAIDYLLKPFSKERFDKSIRKYLENRTASTEQQLVSSGQLPEASERIVLKTNGIIKILPVSEVMYFESYDDYVKIHSADTCYIKKKTMSFYEQSLDQRIFIRIHRSYILNIAFLTRIEQTDKETYTAVLKNGSMLSLSRNGYGLLKSQLKL